MIAHDVTAAANSSLPYASSSTRAHWCTSKEPLRPKDALNVEHSSPQHRLGLRRHRSAIAVSTETKRGSVRVRRLLIGCMASLHDFRTVCSAESADCVVIRATGVAGMIEDKSA